MKEILKFDFPRHICSQLEEVVSYQYLKDLLRDKSEYEDIGNHPRVHFKVFVHRQKYLYAKCYSNGCRASLRYRLNSSGTFSLTKSHLQHEHPLAGFKNHKFRGIVEFIQSLPSSVQASSLKKVVCNQFNISESQFYYLNKKARFPTISLEDLIKKLENEGYEIVVSQEYQKREHPPEIMFVASPKMKQNFKTYGDVAMFDLTFNMVKNIHESDKKWKVGCFVGVSTCKHIVPFGLVLTLKETKETYVQILRTFFESMKGCPKVIITDQEKALLSAIEQLKEGHQYDGINLLDAYHILKNTRKHLKTKEHITFFKQLIHARHQEEFKRICRHTQHCLSLEEMPILERFLKNSYKYCFSQISPTFFGFTATTSNERLHNLIKNVQTSAKQYTITVQTVLKRLQQIDEDMENFVFDKTPFQNFYRISELKAIRYSLTKPILSMFLDQLAKSLNCEFIQGSEFYAYIKQSTIFQLKLDEGGLWNCSCLYKQKSALPCRHILRLLTLKKISFLDQIPQRWKTRLSEQSQRIARKIPLGRERLSRRNRLK